MKTAQESIRAYWDQHPVGTNFIQGEVGKEFFLTYDRFRYTIEPHILTELGAINWKGQRVLEIGTGQGADAMQLILKGALFSGIDLTEESIYRVGERFRLFDVPYEKLQVAAGENIPFPENSFDIVYSHGVIHHSPDMPRMIKEAYRVLRPGGRLIIMVYHKNSLNYWLNIVFIRRIGLLLMRYFPSLVFVVSRLTGEPKQRLQQHILNFKVQGFSYLRLKNFVHKNTDGPANVYSSVWTRKSISPLLSHFSSVHFKVHYLNERHLLGLQKILPKNFKDRLAKLIGWHLWAYALK